jgi:hypothetical protein
MIGDIAFRLLLWQHWLLVREAAVINVEVRIVRLDLAHRTG